MLVQLTSRHAIRRWRANGIGTTLLAGTARPMPTTPILFFDGRCGFCHRGVRVLLRLDRGGRLRFAPLGGDTFHALVPAGDRDGLPDSLALLTPDGRLSVRSAAVVQALRLAGRPAAWLAAAALSLVPARLADRLYDAVARHRSRLFVSPPDECPVPPGPWRGRFLP
jgi:predicted DCC family thiol-disulfide oxidoreductase YuxK